MEQNEVIRSLRQALTTEPVTSMLANGGMKVDLDKLNVMFDDQGMLSGATVVYDSPQGPITKRLEPHRPTALEMTRPEFLDPSFQDGSMTMPCSCLVCAQAQSMTQSEDDEHHETRSLILSERHSSSTPSGMNQTIEHDALLSSTD